MSENDGSGNKNRTVFRPSPLQQRNQGQVQPPQNFEDSIWGRAPSQSQGAGFGAPMQEPPRWDAEAPALSNTRAQQETFRTEPSRLSDDDVPMPSTPRSDRNRLLAEAAPALAIAASFRAGRINIPLPQFHREATQAIASFDRAIAPFYSEETRQRAKYAVCATIDDIAQNAPNLGVDGAEWARRSMVVQFFHEVIGGDRFWQLAEDMQRRPSDNRDIIELFHACLAAGFEGRFRIMPDGKRRLHEIMSSLYGSLDHVRSLSMMEMSPRWKGEDAPADNIGFWRYLMLAGVSALGLLALVFIALKLILMFSGVAPHEKLVALSPKDPLQLARPTEAAAPAADSKQASRLKQFLASEIQQKLVVVEEDSQTVRVRTTVGQLFQSGSDQLEPGREVLFERIAKAVEEDKSGGVTVEGHADSDKVGSLAFPDNMALSRARAETVATILRKVLTDASRISPKGMGENVPIASNDSDDGKSKNRRVEIIVPREY
jgi:type IV/VI secretion system ImpK/VasF family protein